LRIRLFTYATENYRALADLTDENKIRYCEKWGYEFHGRIVPETIEERPYSELGFDKVEFVRDYLDRCDWAWFTDVDSLITNFNKQIEDVINEYSQADFLVATWMNGINAGSYLVKNSDIGKAILDGILSRRGQFIHEQAALIDVVASGKFEDNIKIVPQRLINAGDYNLFGDPTDQANRLDKLGTCGQWEEGDLLIHWPGTTLEHRMTLVYEYLDKVIRS
jgi:hypothetical protein